MSDVNIVSEYLTELTQLMNYGERDLFNAKFSEYSDFLRENNVDALLWERVNEDLLNQHVAVSDYWQS